MTAKDKDKASNQLVVYTRPSSVEAWGEAADLKAKRLGVRVSRNEFIVTALDAAAEDEKTRASE